MFTSTIYRPLTLALLATLALSGCRTPRTGTAGSAALDEGSAATPADGAATTGFIGTLQQNLPAARFALESGLLTSLYAKEVCSCVFVAKLPWRTCRSRVNVFVTDLAIDFDIDEQAKTVRAFGKEDALAPLRDQFFEGDATKKLNPPFVAAFDTARPWLGCKTTTPPPTPTGT